jgi:hypothetical protein
MNVYKVTSPPPFKPPRRQAVIASVSDPNLLIPDPDPADHIVEFTYPKSIKDVQAQEKP